jgi:phosphatidylserine decarboxylase
MSEAPQSAQGPLFSERPTELLAPDAYKLGAAPAGLALLSALAGWGWLALLFAGLALFVAAFFRNPSRVIPQGERSAVAPADGRVIAVGEVEEESGAKALRIGIFLSAFNVHVNRIPISGRVVDVELRSGQYLGAFRSEAESRNARCTLTLETAQGERVRVVQITGWFARRIVCHPRAGEWVRRGDRYGLIRFGSRTDLVLPLGSEPCVRVGESVRGGSSIVAVLPGAPR